MSQSTPARLNTFPKLLLHNAERFAARHAAREKEYGIWQSWTWAELEREIRDFACGLAAMGFVAEDKLAIIGDNRPQLYGAICATQALRGVPVPMYQDAVARELAFVMDHAGARFAIAEDQEQVDKLLELMPECPKLEQIIYLDSRGMRHYEHDFLHSYEEICKRGRDHQAAKPDFWRSSVESTQGEDTAIILYTSGTTGNPKGVVLTHNNVLVTADNAARRDGLNEHDEILAYLPMAWVGDNIFSFAQSYTTGFCVSCPESAATVMHDLNEIGPTFYFAPPRIFENLLTSVTIRMEDAGRVKRWLYGHFMKLAERVGVNILNGEPVSTLDRLHYKLGEVLVYGPLKNTLGFSRIRIAYTAGEAIGP
ncbi:MAG: AMP-binding protein, partial [Gammaproteobacteria bacterium]